MARPRGGGFCYTEAEMAAMERDTEMAVAHGADGVVFGILEAGRPHRPRRVDAAAASLIGDREAVFHRAFDVTPDPFRALDELIDLGITRVLTSGQCDTVWEGLAAHRAARRLREATASRSCRAAASSRTSSTR